ncbi:MAG: 23S rRNA (uracil(1939)-C(5))-methyltransferase RlmD [Gammaproteobacteria bacterium]
MNRARRRYQARRHKQVKRVTLRKPIPLADPVVIEGVAEGGQGIARVDGKALFVNGALVGETVEVALTRRHASYDEGSITRILQGSAQRQAPQCEFFSRCGGCSLQHQQSQAQILDKQTILVEQLSRIGRVEADELAPPLTGNPWGYRRKARLAVSYSGSDNSVSVGFRQRQGNGVVDINRCPILQPQLSALIDPLQNLIAGLKGRERIPQLELVADPRSIAVTVRHLDSLGDEDRRRLREFADQQGVRILLQPAGVDSIHPLSPDIFEPLSYRLADESPGGSPDEQLTISFFPHQFIQVNTELTPQLVNQALHWLDPGPAERIADLFCGVGNFTLPLARRAGQVWGVEGEQSLVDQARENARKNRITNIDFYQHNLFTPLPDKQSKLDKLLLDPPRSGARLICEQMDQLSPQRIVYVSCNAATLARDAQVLVHQRGYRLSRVGVIDMFPQTSHLESMALFEKVG